MGTKTICGSRMLQKMGIRQLNPTSRLVAHFALPVYVTLILETHRNILSRVFKRLNLFRGLHILQLRYQLFLCHLLTIQQLLQQLFDIQSICCLVFIIK